MSRWIELITPLPSLLIRLISVQPPCLKGDFQVLSDLALASPSHPGHPLHLQSRCPAWVFSGTWLYVFLLLGPLFPQVVAVLCPHFRQRSAQRTCVQRIYYHAICHSPPHLSHLPCRYLTPDIFHSHLFLALLFLTCTGL